MLSMSRDPWTDDVWRDYCVQFLGKCYPAVADMDSRRSMADALWEALETRRAAIALLRAEADAPPVNFSGASPRNPRPAFIVVHRLPIISTAKRSDRKMTGYNPASAPSPMSRTLVTTDAADASFFLHDANKNVMQRTDAEGNLLEKNEYAPSEGTRGRTEQASASPPRHSTPRQTSTTTTTGTMRRGSENGQRWIPSMKKDDSLGRTMIVF